MNFAEESRYHRIRCLAVSGNLLCTVLQSHLAGMS